MKRNNVTYPGRIMMHTGKVETPNSPYLSKYKSQTTGQQLAPIQLLQNNCKQGNDLAVSNTVEIIEAVDSGSIASRIKLKTIKIGIYILQLPCLTCSNKKKSVKLPSCVVNRCQRDCEDQRIPWLPPNRGNLEIKVKDAITITVEFWMKVCLMIDTTITIS